ncbi:MAG: hypothetical protein U0V56_07585 [Actinomycetota bacterium]
MAAAAFTLLSFVRLVVVLLFGRRFEEAHDLLRRGEPDHLPARISRRV